METSPQSDTCLLHDFQGQSIWIVTTEIHCFYTSIDNHLGTRSTRLMSAVEAGPSDIRALVCRLDNGILLRVQPPTEFVPLPRGNSHCLPQTTTLRTVLQSPRRSVISLSLIHISEPTRLRRISYAVFCLKKKKKKQQQTT